MVTESTELSVDQDPGVSTQEDGDNQDGACILSLPDAALAVIWACLGPSDKKSLFTASRGLRAALSVHAHAISIKTPSDEGKCPKQHAWAQPHALHACIVALGGLQAIESVSTATLRAGGRIRCSARFPPVPAAAHAAWAAAACHTPLLQQVPSLQVC